MEMLSRIVTDRHPLGLLRLCLGLAPTPRARAALNVASQIGLVVVTGCAIVAMLLPRAICGGGSKQDLAKIQVDSLRSDYATYVVKHPDPLSCPTALAIGKAVDPATIEEDLRDPWGEMLGVLCVPGQGMGVVSAGEDGVFFTHDDIQSWRRP